MLSRQCMRALLAGVLLFTLGAARSWAWGRQGHRLVGLVAEQYLSPAAKAQVAELLRKETLADVASWADDYRSEHPETAPWHFVDIPSTAAAYDRNRDCPLPADDPKSPWRDCVTDRILYFEGRLADTDLPPRERAMALKFLVHFIGDIHQPFHDLGDERGGNGIHVSFLGSTQCGTRVCNLHEVWDDELIEEQRLNDKQMTLMLLAEIRENHWERLAGGEPAAWANAGHRYAVNALVRNGALLGREYVTEETRVVDSQLALAGLRLAHVLNRLLATPAEEPQPGRTPLPRPELPAAPPAY